MGKRVSVTIGKGNKWKTMSKKTLEEMEKLSCHVEYSVVFY